MRTPLAQLSLIPRTVAICALAAAITGSILGLIIGLITYPPTAPFAAAELGLPATLLGAATGLTIGSIILAVRRFGRPHRP